MSNKANYITEYLIKWLERSSGGEEDNSHGEQGTRSALGYFLLVLRTLYDILNLKLLLLLFTHELLTSNKRQVELSRH